MGGKGKGSGAACKFFLNQSINGAGLNNSGQLYFHKCPAAMCSLTTAISDDRIPLGLVYVPFYLGSWHPESLGIVLFSQDLLHDFAKYK